MKNKPKQRVLSDADIKRINKGREDDLNRYHQEVIVIKGKIKEAKDKLSLVKKGCAESIKANRTKVSEDKELLNKQISELKNEKATVEKAIDFLENVKLNTFKVVDDLLERVDVTKSELQKVKADVKDEKDKFNSASLDLTDKAKEIEASIKQLEEDQAEYYKLTSSIESKLLKADLEISMKESALSERSDKIRVEESNIKQTKLNLESYSKALDRREIDLNDVQKLREKLLEDIKANVLKAEDNAKFGAVLASKDGDLKVLSFSLRNKDRDLRRRENNLKLALAKIGD